jgi:hypothetical protein
MHKLTLAALACAVLHAGVARADVTINQTVAGKGLMKMANGEQVIYIKGGKMRSDSPAQKSSSILDLDAQTMTVLDHGKKEATVMSLQQLQETMGKFTDASIKASVEPTGKSGNYAGLACKEYTMKVNAPMKPGGDESMAVDISTTGPICVSDNAPGKDDYATFYLKAAEKGFIFGDPRSAKANPGQAKSMAEMYRQMAKLGLPLYSDITFKMGGSGPMGAIMGRMGGMSMSTTTTKISTDPIADSTFAVPSGYKVKQQN